jgi:hypothetical protein
MISHGSVSPGQFFLDLLLKLLRRHLAGFVQPDCNRSADDPSWPTWPTPHPWSSRLPSAPSSPVVGAHESTSGRTASFATPARPCGETMIDNASSRAMAQFAEPDSVEENLGVGGPGKTLLSICIVCDAAGHVAHSVIRFCSVFPRLRCVHDVQGRNTATPLTTTSLVLRVTRVRLCRMAVAASSPSITGSADFALSAGAAIRPQQSATA